MSRLVKACSIVLATFTLSAFILVPHRLNFLRVSADSTQLVQNNSFESGLTTWQYKGATATADTSFIKPADGADQVRISPSTAASTHGISQSIIVPQSGVYTFSVSVAENQQTAGGEVGIVRADGESIVNFTIPYTTSYIQLTATDIPLEQGDQIRFYAVAGQATTYIDDFSLTADSTQNTPVFGNITSFTVPGQVGSSVIDTNDHTISFTMPSGTDVSALVPTIGLSAGATVSYNGIPRNFMGRVVYKVKCSNNLVQNWTVFCAGYGKS